MRRRGGAAWGLLLVLALPGLAASESSKDLPVELTAVSVEYESERNVYTARGDVVIDYEERRLTADWVSFNPDTRKGVASGHVVITERGDRLEAEFLHFNVDTLEGVVFDGHLESTDSLFELSGEEVRRTGPEVYEFRRGTFTTCRCPEEDDRDPWRIRAEEADLEFDGYGRARNTTFDVLGVPVVWLPWMIYPLKRDRQSGLLFPEFNTSARSGGDVGVPIFWAARHDVNVMLTPRWLFKRGFKSDLEVEYLVGERSEGELYASFLPNDHEVDSNGPKTPFNNTRWAFEGMHDQFLPKDWRLKLDGRFFSDNLFSFDFSDFSEYRKDRYVESSAFLLSPYWSPGAFDSLGLVASVLWANDQQNPDNQDRDQFLLQRLPSLATSLPPQPFRVFGVPLVPAFDLDYAHFYARRDVTDVYPGLPASKILGDGISADTGIDAIPDGEERDKQGSRVPGDANQDDVGLNGPEGDGLFQEGEPLVDRGDRWLVNPRLSAPFRISDFLEVYPEVGYHGTFYVTEQQSPTTRHLLTTQLDVRTRLRRTLTLPFRGLELAHVLEPYVAHTYVNTVPQGGHPIFVPRTAVPQNRIRQFELVDVTRDPADRIATVNTVTLGAVNRFYRSTEGLPSLFADVWLSGQYDIYRDEFTFFYLDGSMRPAPRWRTRAILGVGLEQPELSEGFFLLGWTHPFGHDLSLRYRYLRDPPRFFENFRFERDRFDEFEDNFNEINQIGVAARAALSRSWALFYNGQFSFDQSLNLKNQGGVEYLSACECWAIRLEVEDDRQRGYQFNVRYRILGLGKDEDPRRPFSGGRRGFIDDRS